MTLTEAKLSLRNGAMIRGNLVVPEKMLGLIIFAHGSGSSRHSPRNRFVADILNDMGFATLLLDLLTQAEEQRDVQTREYRFNIRLLADRLEEAAAWIECDPHLGGLPAGYFGSSTGAAAALIAAAEQPARIKAIVCRGGRIDLTDEALSQVQAPTLLIVGGEDSVIMDLNHQAMARMRCEVRLKIIPGATHLFEEPGKLERVANAAADWFLRKM